MIPKWTDDDAVAVFVTDLIEQSERDFDTLAWDTHPGLPASEIFESMERSAIAAAEGNNFGPVTELMEGRNPLVRWLGMKGFRLGPRALALIAGRLRGERGRRGRPKQTPEDRFTNTPSHGAAIEFDMIEEILKRSFPGQKGIRDRAIALAADRSNIPYSRLENYLKDHPRPPRLP